MQLVRRCSIFLVLFARLVSIGYSVCLSACQGAVAVAAVAVAVVAVAEAVEAVVMWLPAEQAYAAALVSKSQAACFATVTASHGPHSVHDTRGAE